MSNQRYVAIEKIGQGGLGEVYLAKDTQLDREVALKRVRVPEGGNGDAMAEDLIREAKTLSALQHPNIVTIYDVGRDEQGPFVIMELLKGETLDAVLQRGALQAEDFQRIVVETLEGMIAAQAVGLVHRDLKPGNLMVVWLASGRFQIKILDFGLAKFTRKPGVQTEDQGGGIFGSIYFMAPEQFERLPLDARTDMYSLGCIYYQILTTQHPFDGESPAGVMASHLQHHVTPVNLLRTDLPEWLGHWVMWLISRDMDDRPPDARTALEYFHRQSHGLRVANPAPSTLARSGPAATQRGYPAAGGRQTQNIPVGTMATARLSTAAAQRVAPPRKAGLRWLWITLAVLAVGGIVTGIMLVMKGGQKGQGGGLAELLAQDSPKGDAATVAMLAGMINKSGPETPSAVKVLKKLQGEGIGDAIVKEVEKASGTGQRLLAECLIDKPSTKAGPVLTKIVLAGSGPARDVALKALVKCATGADLPGLIKEQDKLKQDEARLFEIIDAALSRETDEAARVSTLGAAVRSSKGQLRAKLLTMLVKSGSTEAVALLSEELANADPVIRDAALAGLARMPATPGLADAVLKAATGADKEKLLAAYFSICSRLGLNGEDRTAYLRKAAKDATGVAKSAMEEALASIADPTASNLATELGLGPAGEHIQNLLSKVSKYSGSELSATADKAVILGAAGASYSSSMKAIQNWTDPGTSVAWDIEVPQGGIYELFVEQSLNMRNKREYRITLGDRSVVMEVKPTGSTEVYEMVACGDFSLSKPGSYRVGIEPVTMESGQSLMLVRSLKIRKK